MPPLAQSVIMRAYVIMVHILPRVNNYRLRMRVASLDSVRGLAALTVVFGHCYLTFPESVRWGIHAADPRAWMSIWAWLRFTPLRLLVQGQAAVIVFFVLSGLVLAFPFVRGSQLPYPRYVIKRVCRIYLPFAVAILFAAVMYIVVAPSPITPLSEWFNVESWSHPISGREVVRHLLMTGLKADRDLDNPTWSLVHELRISIIFPFLVVGLYRFGALQAVIGALALHLACITLLLHIDDDTLIGTVLTTGEFVVFFVCGIALAVHWETWQAWLRRRTNLTRAGLWGAALLGLLFPATDVLGAHLAWGVGAVGIIALSLTSPFAERFLTLGPIMWLGRVSYSLYLIHLIVLLAAVHLLFGELPLPLILLGGVLLSLACAELMYRCIERPAIDIGQRLARARTPKAPIVSSR